MSDKQLNLKIVIRDHLLVHKKGGLVSVRDRIEEYEGGIEEAVKRINGRIDKYLPVSVAKEPNKAKREENQRLRDSWLALVKGNVNSLIMGQHITKTFTLDNRKRFTYTVTKVQPFGHATVSSKAKARVHYGLSTPEQIEAAKKSLAETRIKLGLNPDGTVKDDTPPFSMVDDKPKGGKGKASAPASKPKTSKKAEKKVDTKQSGMVTLTKRQQNECDKFKLDPANLPDSKPKGMNNKVWNAIKKAV